MLDFGDDALAADSRRIMRGDRAASIPLRRLPGVSRSTYSTIGSPSSPRATRDVRSSSRSGGGPHLDLVVGADGVHSGYASSPLAPRLTTCATGAYTAYFTVPDPGDLQDWFLCTTRGPAERGRPSRARRHRESHAQLRSPPLEYDRRTSPAAEDPGRRLCRSGLALARAARRDVGCARLYFDTICRSLKDWWASCAVLLGDAGYCASPLTGLGTSNGAGRRVRAEPGNWRAALTTTRRHSPATRTRCATSVAACHKLPRVG